MHDLSQAAHCPVLPEPVLSTPLAADASEIQQQASAFEPSLPADQPVFQQAAQAHQQPSPGPPNGVYPEQSEGQPFKRCSAHVPRNVCSFVMPSMADRPEANPQSIPSSPLKTAQAAEAVVGKPANHVSSAVASVTTGQLTQRQHVGNNPLQNLSRLVSVPAGKTAQLKPLKTSLQAGSKVSGSEPLASPGMSTDAEHYASKAREKPFEVGSPNSSSRVAGRKGGIGRLKGRGRGRSGLHRAKFAEPAGRWRYCDIAAAHMHCKAF